MGKYNNNPQRNKLKLAARQSYKPALAIRAMAGQTAWLKGRMHWVGGRVGWEDGATVFVPQSGDIALAQRRLNQIGGASGAARRTLGDSQSWLTDRHERLQLAKQLHSLYEPDLPTLATASYDPARWRRLVTLLSVEMLCGEPLPSSPARALLASGGPALATLREWAADPTQPTAGRELAALVIGAVEHDSPEYGPGGVVWPDGRTEAAYGWGLRQGFPAHHRLILLLLAEPEGAELARRGLAALVAHARCQLPAETLRDFFLQGTPADEVVEIAEAAVRINPLFRYPWVISENEALKTHLKGLDLHQLRKTYTNAPYFYDLGPYPDESVMKIKDTLYEYVGNIRQGAAIDYIGRYIQQFLALGGRDYYPKQQLLQSLTSGLALPKALQLDYLKILVEEHEQLWDVARFYDYYRGNFWNWLYEATSNIEILCRLLQRVEDVELIREIIEQKAVDELSRYSWPDPERYWLVLRLNRHFNPSKRYMLGKLAGVVNIFPNIRAAQTAFEPLLNVIQKLDRTQYYDLFLAIFSQCPTKAQEARQWLTRLAHYVPKLIDFYQTDDDFEEAAITTLDMTVWLDQNLEAEEAERWLTEALKILVDLLQNKRDSVTLRGGYASERLLIAAILAKGELKTFLAGVELAATHEDGFKSTETCRAGLRVLARYPLLERALGQIAPFHYTRCLQLIDRLGRATRLGREVLKPFEALRFEEALAADPEWQTLTDLAPQQSQFVRLYRLARRLVGESEAMPGGLKRVLQSPTRLANELAHLESRLADQPDQPHLAIRAANLRLRLAEETRLQGTVQAEIAHRLPHAWAEAMLVAAEGQLLEGYRQRLAVLVRELPSDLEMNDDLLNATLLTTDIDDNQVWLVRLLRSWLTGDRTWRERLPGNVEFLAKLAANGGSVESWLAENPRTFEAVGLGRGPILLRLETNPLQVLQMGNYFDTCLSLGNFNAFSTVTNAIELNKRVVYATDAGGNVIGRKLIAITTDNKLVGFRTYLGLEAEKANRILHDLFREYCEELSRRCHLELSNDGEVARLLADCWYDDGLEFWQFTPPAPETPKHPL